MGSSRGGRGTDIVLTVLFMGRGNVEKALAANNAVGGEFLLERDRMANGGEEIAAKGVLCTRWRERERWIVGTNRGSSREEYARLILKWLGSQTLDPGTLLYRTTG